MSKALLITGAGGHLGSRLARHYLELAGRPVILWLHAADRSELERKTHALREELGALADSAEIRGGDLRDPRPFESVDPAEVGEVLHCAAVTRFNVEESLAREVNIEGSIKLYEFASRCKGLDRLALLSSVYACGLRSGSIEENFIDVEPQFANFYEWSKWESERRLRADFPQLPSMVLRTATLIAESARGRVCQYNAFHNTLKLLFYGLVSLVPGDRDTPLYFVTSDFVVDAVTRVLERGEPGGVYHICHGADESTTLGDLIDTAYLRFSMDTDFHERRILKPLFCDQASFRMLVDGVGRFGGEVVRQGLESVVPFAAQLFSHKVFANERLKELLDVYAAPDASELVSNTCDHLLATRWGRRLDDAA